MSVKLNQCITTQNLLSVLHGQHENVTIEGNDYGLITIGSRRYLIDYRRSSYGLKWYSDDTTRLDYISKAGSGTAVNMLPMNNLCMPYLDSDQVRSNSWEDALKSTTTLYNIITSRSGISPNNRVKYAGFYVNSLNTLGLRWSLPNYELISYILNEIDDQYNNHKFRDWLLDSTGWYDIMYTRGEIYFWLPFASGSSERSLAWIYGCQSQSGTDFTYSDRTSVNVLSLPCTLL